MKKIAVIAPASLPIPAVRGGAVETLVELFIQQNEKGKKAELIIVSPFDEFAFQKSRKYANTFFLWYKNRGLYARAKNAMDRLVIAPLFHRNFISDDFFQIIRLLKDKEFDHIVMESRSEMINSLGRVFGKEKLVCHIHIRPQMVSGMYENCSRVLAVSQYVKDEIVKYTDTPEEKVCVLKNCVDLSKFRPSAEYRRQTRMKYALQEDEAAICYVGRLVEMKGIGHLMSAFSMLKTKTKCRLFVVGALSGHFFSDKEKPTPFVEKIQKLVSALGDKVVFTGYMENDDLPFFLNGMDIAVMPSLYKEAASVSNVEYQAVGLPVITTCMGGIPEYVTEKSAIIVKNDQHLDVSISTALSRLIEDVNLRKTMGAFGIANAGLFSSERYLDKLLALL